MLVKDGAIVQQAAPVTTYRQPATAYAAGLFGRYNLLSAAIFPGTQPRLFLRPEQISIVNEGGVKAIVQRVDFIGPVFEVEVLAAGERLLLHTNREGIAVGDEVLLAISGNGHWYMPA
ncbi:TOBE domain-containing protein [Chitinophaga sedimenti]|nr:TOBE domain-containing protein [Chitinophaga sedimenti]